MLYIQLRGKSLCFRTTKSNLVSYNIRKSGFAEASNNLSHFNKASSIFFSISNPMSRALMVRRIYKNDEIKNCPLFFVQYPG